MKARERIIKEAQNQELPILTTQYYIFEKRQVNKQKRKINKELKAALRAIKTIIS